MKLCTSLCMNNQSLCEWALACAVGGQWTTTAKTRSLPDPLNGSRFMEVPDTQIQEAGPFIESLKAVPKTGLHNPWKNPER